jgi:hypothetical protein
MQLLNVNLVMKHVKRYYEPTESSLKVVDEDFEVQELRDSNNINKVIFISYMFKTFKQINIILVLSFVTGILFYIVSDIARGYNDVDFITVFHLHEMDVSKVVLILTYFSFTSLSTIGLGDFHPKNSTERIFISVTLLLGVSTFSYIMGNFSTILSKFKKLD